MNKIKEAKIITRNLVHDQKMNGELGNDKMGNERRNKKKEVKIVTRNLVHDKYLFMS